MGSTDTLLELRILILYFGSVLILFWINSA